MRRCRHRRLPDGALTVAHEDELVIDSHLSSGAARTMDTAVTLRFASQPADLSALGRALRGRLVE
ncbi:MAG TPA: hypothetical protein VJ975_10695, partial [Candidatus Limnocylindria bacterium]|nr:hypothetical protein [Candidatus Limnocylindria bacterium]